ncbi:MAG: hypothetical protein CL781_00070 [Chloroflexi bacterium]|nr:hypothetical protein [Chloroflexota bacterium]|tara:strand:- start:12437 stop:13348 length:912 start_codon:yes stop_codon:yes gene_type:complete
MIDWKTPELLSYRKLPVLVTGSTGFIGNRLIEVLNILDANITQIARRQQKNDPRVLKCDLSDYEACQTLIQSKSFKIIFHAAGWVSSDISMGNVNKANKNNVIATLNLLEAATNAAKSPKIVIPGSILENSDIKNPYTVSKSAASLYADLYSSNYNADISKLMICLTYGPHQKLNSLVPYTINSLNIARGPIKLKLNRYLDILFVDDLIHALLKAGLAMKPVKPIYIGTNQLLTVKDITTLIAELMGKDPNLIEFESDDCKYETILKPKHLEDAKTSLDWTPNWSLSQGLEKTIDWYVNEGQI